MLFLDSVMPNRNLTLRYFENFRGGIVNFQGKIPPGNMPRINTVSVCSQIDANYR